MDNKILKTFEKMNKIDKELSFWAVQLVYARKMNLEYTEKKCFEKLVVLTVEKDRIFNKIFV